MKNKINKQTSLFWILTLLVLSSCDKDKNFEFKNNPPESAYNTQTAVFPISIQTKGLEHFETSTQSSYLIGNINDAELGNSFAGFYAQWLLDKESQSLGIDNIVDSVVLRLAFSGKNKRVGDSSELQKWKVYTLKDALLTGSYKSDSFAILQDEIQQSTAVRLSNNDTMVNIRLQNAFGQGIVNLSTADLASNASFIEKLKGLAILPDTSTGLIKGAMGLFSVADSRTRLIIYYKDASKVSQTFALKVTPDSKRFGVYRNNHNGKGVFQNPNYAYLQSNSGLKVITTDKTWLTSLLDVNIALVKSEIIFKADVQNNGFLHPDRLMLYPIDSYGNIFYDASLLQANAYFQPAYNGVWNEKDSTYTFNLNIYFQKLLNSYKNGGNISKFYGLALFARFNDPYFPESYALPLQYQRVRFFKDKASIKLTYTK